MIGVEVENENLTHCLSDLLIELIKQGYLK